MAGADTQEAVRAFVAKAEEQYRRATPASQAEYERTSALIPSGTPAGIAFVNPYPIYVERAEGCYVYDVDGRRMVDLLFGD